MAVDPEIVKRAIELNIIPASRADEFLRDPPPAARVLQIVPRTPPPPERLVRSRYRGRLRRGRAKMTRALLGIGVLDPEAVKLRPLEHPPPEEDTAS